jgi:hypothetical protein
MKVTVAVIAPFWTPAVTLLSPHAARSAPSVNGVRKTGPSRRGHDQASVAPQVLRTFSASRVSESDTTTSSDAVRTSRYTSTCGTSSGGVSGANSPAIARA